MGEDNTHEKEGGSLDHADRISESSPEISETNQEQTYNEDDEDIPSTSL